MAVSANTLFHFTSKNGLLGILSSGGFFSQYSDEHFENILPANSHFRFTYIPMTSFCDLTIMQLANDSVHRDSFGDFGIGLTKKWGEKNGVSPVMYVHRRSQQTKRLYQLIKVLRDLRKKELTEETNASIDEIEQEMIDSFKYIKPYSGYWHKGKKIKKSLIYYNEREWRFCPKVSEFRVLSAIIKENENEKNILNLKLRVPSLSFSPEDVKFIILKNKKSINQVANVIKKMKIDTSKKNELITKIITFEEIKEDF